MSVFNRIFRTKAHISRVEICRYMLKHGMVPEKGVEIQLHHVFRGGNLPIILPLRVLRGLPELLDENNNFSTELLAGCNIALEIQKTSFYKRKKAEIKRKKRELQKAGVRGGGKAREAELARAKQILSQRIREQERLRKQIEERQRAMKRKKVV